MMMHSRMLRITLASLLFSFDGLVSGAQSAPNATAPNPAPTAAQANTPPAAGVPHFEFDRKPEPIHFQDGEVHLAGVLVLPEGSGPFPAVVFAHGAGPATHDEPAFVVHANAFLRQGFAVLSYDKRGSGASTGNLETSDYDDFARDLAAAVKYLRGRKEIVGSKIGLLGRSEGAWVATLAASHDPSIAFVVMSSGSGVKPYDETLYWTRGALRAKRMPDLRIEQALQVKAAIWDFYRDVSEGKLSKEEATKTLASLRARLSEFSQYQPELPSGIMDPDVESREKFTAFAHIMFYDPQPAFRGAQAPLLEIIGDKDEVVEPSSTIAVMQDLAKSGHDVTVKSYPGVGHSLLVMDGPRILGYPDGYLAEVVSWAQEKTRDKNSAP